MDLNKIRNEEGVEAEGVAKATLQTTINRWNDSDEPDSIVQIESIWFFTEATKAAVLEICNA